MTTNEPSGDPSAVDVRDALAAPQLALQSVYLKDCSYEAPNGPRIDGTWNPQISLDLNTTVNAITTELREVILVNGRTPVVQTGKEGQNLGELVVTLDGGQLKVESYRLHPIDETVAGDRIKPRRGVTAAHAANHNRQPGVTRVGDDNQIEAVEPGLGRLAYPIAKLAEDGHGHIARRRRCGELLDETAHTGNALALGRARR